MQRGYGDYHLHETLRAPEPYVSAYVASPGTSSRLVELRTLNLSPEGAAAALAKKLELVRAISHPGLMRIIEVGTVEGVPFLVTDHRDSITLGEYLARRGGRLDPELAFDLLAPVVEAVHQLHQKGLVHGEISADSIRVEEASDRAYLATVAMARLAGIDPARVGYRSTAAAAAAAPELSEGRAPDARTDLYQLCAVLYQAVTGRRVAGRKGGEALPPLPSAVVQGLPQAVDKTIFPGLQVKPSDRPGGLDLLIEALRFGRDALKEEGAPRKGTSRAIHLAALEKRQDQDLRVKDDRRKRRRRNEDAGPLQAAADRFARLSPVLQLALFALIASLSAQIPAPDLLFSPGPAVLDQYESNRVAVANKQFDRKGIEEKLLELAEESGRTPTDALSYADRLQTLRAFLKSIRKDEREKLISSEALAEMRLVFAKDQRSGSALLDKHLRAAAAYLKARPKP